MHSSSYLSALRFKMEYVRPGAKVVEAGSKSFHGQPGHRDLFSDCQFLGTDKDAGEGVDRVVNWEKALDVLALVDEEGLFDVLICGQMLEHCAHFWDALAHFRHAVRPGGLVYIVAPGHQTYHDPPDYWRFHQDATTVWGELLKADPLETWGQLPEYPGDVGGIYRVQD